MHAGAIAIRAGIPHDEDPWGWSCGFYPGSEPGEYLYGTAIDFDQARRDFEAAWRVFSAKRTEADFQEWRDQSDWTARKVVDIDKRHSQAQHEVGQTSREIAPTGRAGAEGENAKVIRA